MFKLLKNWLWPITPAAGTDVVWRDGPYRIVKTDGDQFIPLYKKSGIYLRRQDGAVDTFCTPAYIVEHCTVTTEEIARLRIEGHRFPRDAVRRLERVL